MSVNARQKGVLGINRFQALYELSQSLRDRPEAFDGGFRRAVATPDVILTQEFSDSNLEIFERLLRQRFKIRYEIAGDPNAHGGIIINTATISLNGDVRSWNDLCLNGREGTRFEPRTFQIAHLIEKQSGLPFTVASIHFFNKYNLTEQEDCLFRNVKELQSQLEGDTGPVIIGGDFNKRAVLEQRECDPNETSAPLAWWTQLTSPDEGRAYNDAVQLFHRQRAQSIADEWTFERPALQPLCDGSEGRKRSRLDYFFVSGVVIADAHADHPGWAGDAPGSYNEEVYRYSDHRFIWGRFVLAGPPRPPVPSQTPTARGVIDLEWQPDASAAQWRLYRSIGARPFDLLAELPAEQVTFSDDFTEHGVTYRYSIAGIDVEGNQGRESASAWATADARGPRAIAVTPRAQATAVDRKTVVRVIFDEPVESDFSPTALSVYRGQKRVRGTLSRPRRRVLEFDPRRPLRWGERYRVVLEPVRDQLGNRSGRLVWTFTTEKKRKR